MSRDVLSRCPGLRLGLYRLGFAVAPRLGAGVRAALCGSAGALVWWLDGRGRRVVETNLAGLLDLPAGHERVRGLARCSYRRFLEHLLDTFRLPQLRTPWPRRLRIIDPWGVLAKPWDGPRVLATVHANWELLAPVLRGLGIRASNRSIVLGREDQRVDRLFERARAAHRIRAVRHDRAPLASLRALREGRTVGIVADRDYSGHGLELRCGNRVARLPAGPAALAVQTGADIVPAMVVRDGRDAVVLIIAKPLRTQAGEPRKAAVQRLGQELGNTLLRLLRAAPGQWVAFHPYWSALPTAGRQAR
jgi:KDO2-lipid IV(A) lauroyltransferase